MGQDVKRCYHCGAEKPVEEFYMDRRARPQSWCKECVKERQARYYHEHKGDPDWLRRQYEASRACKERKASNGRLPAVECPTCGKLFRPTHGNMLYCCMTCRLVNEYRRQAAKSGGAV